MIIYKHIVNMVSIGMHLKAILTLIIRFGHFSLTEGRTNKLKLESIYNCLIFQIKEENGRVWRGGIKRASFH